MILTCTECLDLLADYADGQVGDRARRPLEAHLADCGDCRAQLAVERRLSGLLQCSIAAAPNRHFLIWPTRAARPPAKVYRWRAATAAASFAAAAMLALFWRCWPSPIGQAVASRSATNSTTVVAEQSFADVEAAIEREASAARLAASAEMLGTEPAASEYAIEAMRWVAEAFPETKAGRRAVRGAGLKQPAMESL